MNDAVADAWGTLATVGHYLIGGACIECRHDSHREPLAGGDEACQWIKGACEKAGDLREEFLALVATLDKHWKSFDRTVYVCDTTVRML